MLVQRRDGKYVLRRKKEKNKEGERGGIEWMAGVEEAEGGVARKSASWALQGLRTYFSPARLLPAVCCSAASSSNIALVSDDRGL